MGYDYDISLPVYEQVKAGNIQTSKAKVYEAICALGPCTDRMIAIKLGWEINRVTPRRGELLSAGKIRLMKKDFCPIGGKRVNWWVNAKVQLDLF